MDHSSQPTSTYHHHQQVRVVKPNRTQHGSHNANNAYDHFDRQTRSRQFTPTPNSFHHQADSTTAPAVPAVKILAKSNNNRPQGPSASAVSAASSNAAAAAQENNKIAQTQNATKTPTTIVANRQSVAGIVPRPADAVTVTSRQTGNSGSTNSTANTAHHRQNSKPSISNSVSILEKQLARMHIVPSADYRERELLFNCTKLLDGEFNLQDTNVLERCLLSDGQSSNQSPTTPSGQSFCIVGAVGLDGVGKSTLLNTIANRNVFKTHCNVVEDRRNMTTSSTASKGGNNGQDNPLSHVTNGVDLHITAERLFLLDTQPLLSASILDEFLRNTGTGTSMFTSGGPNFNHHHHHHHNHTANGSGAFSLSSVMGFDITEPENFSYIYSMQLLTFMFSICDHLPKQEQVSLALPSKSTAPGASFKKSKDIEQQGQTFSSGFKINSPTPQRSASHNRMLQLLKNTIVAMLGPNVNIDFITDEQRLLATVLKPPSRNLLLTDSQSRPISYTTERAWFHSVQRFWDNSIHKSTLFADYARYLP
ncbi:smg-9, nonsense mediated mRNA decay factor [Tyrophagus putrescentiae]|nr:smg-9, nonsense mediated mRNA decay factor [Tyrophagus putrescentiae]